MYTKQGLQISIETNRGHLYFVKYRIKKKIIKGKNFLKLYRKHFPLKTFFNIINIFVVISQEN